MLSLVFKSLGGNICVSVQIVNPLRNFKSKKFLKNNSSQIRDGAKYDVGELEESLDSDQINKLIAISATARKLKHKFFTTGIILIRKIFRFKLTMKGYISNLLKFFGNSWNWFYPVSKRLIKMIWFRFLIRIHSDGFQKNKISKNIKTISFGISESETFKVIHLIRAALMKKAGATNETSDMFGFTTNFSLIKTLKREGAPIENLQLSAESILHAIVDADAGWFLTFECPTRKPVSHIFDFMGHTWVILWVWKVGTFIRWTRTTNINNNVQFHQLGKMQYKYQRINQESNAIDFCMSKVPFYIRVWYLCLSVT